MSTTEQADWTDSDFAWVGGYDVGGRGLYPSPTLTLTHRDGLTYRYASCSYVAPPRNFAILRATENLIQVDLGSSAEDLPELSRVYVYARWGSSEFVVPEQLMRDFCFYANDRSNHNSRTSPFPMRRSPYAWATSAGTPIPAPIVPPEYQKYLLRDVVDTAVLESSVRLTGEKYEHLDQPIVEASVRVGAGRDRGLLPGMSLFFSDLDGWGEGKLVDVDASSSRAVFSKRIDDADHLPDVPIGSRVSSTARGRS